jgi:hypothetical protein
MDKDNEIKIIKWNMYYINPAFLISLIIFAAVIVAPLLLDVSRGVASMIFLFFGSVPMFVFFRCLASIFDKYERVSINYADKTFKVFRSIVVMNALIPSNATYNFSELLDAEDQYDRIKLSFYKKDLRRSEYVKYDCTTIRTTHLDHSHKEILQIFKNILELNKIEEEPQL